MIRHTIISPSKKELMQPWRYLAGKNIKNEEGKWKTTPLVPLLPRNIITVQREAF